MEYLSEQEVISAFYNLINIQTEIYDLTMEKLLELEKNGISNPFEYDKIIKRINRLRIKETRIYEKLNNSEYYYGLIDNIQSMIRSMAGDDVKKYTAIDERIDYHFNELFNEECLTLEINQNIDDYVDLDDYDEGLFIIPTFNTVDFYSPIQVKFLRELKAMDPENEEFLKYKFYHSFICPRLEDELVLARYNPDNVCDVDDELRASINGIDFDEYMKSVEAAKENFALDAFDRFTMATSDVSAEASKLELPYQAVLFAVSNLSTRKIAEFMKKHFNGEEDYAISLEAVDYFESLGNSLLQVIFEREDYDESILNILNSDSVDLQNSSIKFEPEVYDNLFNLVKISLEIYFKTTELYCLDLIGKKGSSLYLDKLDMVEELTKKEKEYVANLSFTDDEKPAVRELIENYLEFIYKLDGRDGLISNNEVDIEIVKKRLKNILWNERVFDLSTFRDESVPSAIIKNYQIECLDEYEKHVLADDSGDYLAFKYMEVVSDPELFDEFIFERGYIEEAILLDDEITCRILDIDLEEYLYDKDDLLANHVYDIMASLVKFPKDYELSGFEKALLDYQTIALEIAFKYVNEEELEEFKSNFASSAMVENSLLGKHLKSIFNKKDKKLELSKKRH